MQNSVAKKLFAVGVAASTVLLGVAPLAASAAPHAAGTNVSSSDGTVWMITSDGYRRPYTSAGAFLSYGFNSFASVVQANSDDLALPAGSFIPPQDGSIICSDRGADKGTCYFISAGQKYGFTSASVFTGLGFSFANSKMGDVSWMPAGASLINSSTMAHMTGALINKSGTVYLVGANGNLLGIPDLNTFNSWGYSFANVVPANAADSGSQTGVMAMRTAGMLSPNWTTSGGNTGGNNPPPVVSGSVQASLAADTPAANTIAISSTAGVKTVVTLANFMFTGSGTVTQLQVKRIGVSADSDLGNVYLFNGASRLTDAASVGGSSLITFNNPSGLFTVNGSMEVSVVAEIPNGTSAGKTIGAQLTSFTVASGSPATVSISGNLMTTASATDLAYANFGTVTPTGGAYDPAKDVVVFQSNVSINQRDMTMSRFIIRNIGSAQQGDINNFRLRVDGNQIAQTQSMDSNGYVTFSFSPMTMKAGTRQVQVLADVIGGSSRNFQYQIRNASDVNFTDTQYNVTSSASNTFPVGSASSNSINSGTLTIVKTSDSPSGNVTNGASDVVLAKYTLTAYGEPMQIQTLTADASSSDSAVGSLRNGRILINGVQYGSTATLNNSAAGTSYTLNYTVQPGSPVTLELHADMFDNDGTNSLVNNDTVTGYIYAGSSNVQKMVSLGYVSAPSANVAGNAITVVTGSMSLSKNATYANQTIPQPQTGYLLGSFNLVGSTSEDINLTGVDINLKGGTNSSSSLANLNNVTLKINGNMYGTVKGTVAVSNSTSTFSGNLTISKGTTVPVLVYADIPAVSVPNGSDNFVATMCANGTTVSSSVSVSSCTTGQNISIGTASLTVAQDPSTPVAALIAGNQTKTLAAFKFTTANDQYTVSDITISLASNTTVSTLSLWDGSTQVGSSLPGGASSTFSNLNWQIPANSTHILTVQAVLGPVGIGAGVSGEPVQAVLHSYKAAPSSSGTYTTTTSGTSVKGNTQYVFKSIPTITLNTLPTSALVAGTDVLQAFQLSSGGTGTIGWTHLVFTYATSDAATTLASPQLWDADANSQITASASVDATNKRIVFDTATEQQISGAKNYQLKATVGGTVSTGDYVATNIANPDTTFTPPTTAASATTTVATSFVWSDVSAQSHSLTTSDWNNDFLVKNLPTNTQTLTK